MPKLTYEEVMEKLNDERIVKAKDVPANVQCRVVWIAEWHLPGCMSESQSLCTTKAEAINACRAMAANEFGCSPRGMLKAMQKFERFDSESEVYGTCINTVSKHTLAEFLS